MLERAPGLDLQDHPDLRPATLIEILVDSLHLVHVADKRQPDDVCAFSSEAQSIGAVGPEQIDLQLSVGQIDPFPRAQLCALWAGRGDAKLDRVSIDCLHDASELAVIKPYVMAAARGRECLGQRTA